MALNLALGYEKEAIVIINLDLPRMIIITIASRKTINIRNHIEVPIVIDSNRLQPPF
jgi:hypothetical protein